MTVLTKNPRENPRKPTKLEKALRCRTQQKFHHWHAPRVAFPRSLARTRVLCLRFYLSPKLETTSGLQAQSGSSFNHLENFSTPV